MAAWEAGRNLKPHVYAHMAGSVVWNSRVSWIASDRSSAQIPCAEVASALAEVQALLSLPENYIEALGRLGAAFAAYEAKTGHAAILVGGAAAAIHTDGAFMSADFDVVAGADQAFAEAMSAAGFVADDKAVHGLGWYHPDYPELGVEQVSGAFFDGRGDRDRCLRLVLQGN